MLKKIRFHVPLKTYHGKITVDELRAAEEYEWKFSVDTKDLRRVYCQTAVYRRITGRDSWQNT
jgi:hypothetical protein